MDIVHFIPITAGWVTHSFVDWEEEWIYDSVLPSLVNNLRQDFKNKVVISDILRTTNTHTFCPVGVLILLINWCWCARSLNLSSFEMHFFIFFALKCIVPSQGYDYSWNTICLNMIDMFSINCNFFLVISIFLACPAQKNPKKQNRTLIVSYSSIYSSM